VNRLCHTRLRYFAFVAISFMMATVFLLASAKRSHAIVVFDFDFIDAPGAGFNAPDPVGADRRAGLAQAANYVSSVLGSAYSANISLTVNGSVTADTTLANASSAFTTTTYPGNGFQSRGDVMLKILGGNAADPSPGVPDGSVNYNFEDFVWEPLSDFQPGELDLISTAIHELTHAIGFASDITQTGVSSWGDGPGTPTAWSPFDEFVADTTGSLIDGTFALDGTRWNAASVGGTGTSAGLLFNGPNAMAANGGNPVALYSPTTWSDGSSGSHLDTNFYTGMGGTIENMMNHASSIAEGLDIRQYTAIERGILRDIGYTAVAIPEPSALLLVGLFLSLVCGKTYLPRISGLRKA
jgi:hypothetical protein